MNNVFGQLTVIKMDGKKWFCRCSCGKEKFISKNDLLRKDGKATKSCGCGRLVLLKQLSQKNKKHGFNKTPTYRSWYSMKSRCNNPNSTGYHNYGGRGISICSEWNDFENFVRDMGARPKDTSLDRIDVNKGYFPQNCRWAKIEEQNNNRRNSKFITFRGEKLTQAQISRKYNIGRHIISRRLKSGWNIEKAILTPPKGKKEP